jgi:Zn finger protein HypA/HybF involved in hydrogenase expression|tara:strand:+ start:103 stop:315 length:213 start_codon:yes stop_codon:yes gene_type:complete
MKKLKFDFKNIDTVVGFCEECREDSVLVSVVTDYYRCTNCGTDTKQYVNGRIRYMQLTEEDKSWLRDNRG